MATSIAGLLGRKEAVACHISQDQNLAWMRELLGTVSILHQLEHQDAINKGFRRRLYTSIGAVRGSP